MLKKMLFSFLVIFFSLATTALAESEWDKEGVSINKEWTIQFSMNLLESSISGSNIYVKNSEDEKLTSIQLDYNQNNQTVRVSNVDSYKASQTYYLYITNGIKSKSGKAVAEEVIMEFQTSDSSSTPPSSTEDTEDNFTNILNKYEEKFNQLSEHAESKFTQLKKDAKEDYENGATKEELESEYAPKLFKLQRNTDNSFEEIYEDFVNELQENGYSEKQAEAYKDKYEQESQERIDEISNIADDL